MKKIRAVEMFLTELSPYVRISRGQRVTTYRHAGEASLARISVACQRQLLHGIGTVIPYSNGWSWVNTEVRSTV